jgi:hypothetical protein
MGRLGLGYVALAGPKAAHMHHSGFLRDCQQGRPGNKSFGLWIRVDAVKNASENSRIHGKPPEDIGAGMSSIFECLSDQVAPLELGHRGGCAILSTCRASGAVK